MMCETETLILWQRRSTSITQLRQIETGLLHSVTSDRLIDCRCCCCCCYPLPPFRLPVRPTPRSSSNAIIGGRPPASSPLLYNTTECRPVCFGISSTMRICQAYNRQSVLSACRILLLLLLLVVALAHMETILGPPVRTIPKHHHSPSPWSASLAGRSEVE